MQFSQPATYRSQSSVSTDSSECYIEPGQRPRTPPPAHQSPTQGQSQQPHEYSGHTTPTDLSQKRPAQTTYDNEAQCNYQAASHFTEQVRFIQLNSHQLGNDSVPAYGKEKIDGPAINVYARILITQPGDLITKTLTNPHVAQSFRLHLPNNYQTIFYKDRMFITTLLNTAKSILEDSFPFPFFDKANLKYILEADSIFYSYAVAGQYFFHRINISHLRAMDPALRDEYLDKNTPQPVSFVCTNGKVFDANYDIVILVHNVVPRPLQAPQTQNEAFLVMKVNALIKEKIDAVGTVAKVLAIYHDYRIATLKKPVTVPRTNSEHLPPAQPSMYHPSTVTGVAPIPVPLHEVIIKPDARQIHQRVNMLYVPPYRRTMESSQSTSTGEIHQPRTPSQERTYQQAIDEMRKLYASPYEDNVSTSQDLPKAAKRKTRNRIVDPTTPWARSADHGTKP